MNDPDVRKGAVEGDARAESKRGQNGNTSLSGQNPHRTESRLIKANDSDFPEPGSSPEHSGQKAAGEKLSEQPEPGGGHAGHSPEGDPVNQDPGHRQKRNQSDKKDDPLAA